MSFLKPTDVTKKLVEIFSAHEDFQHFTEVTRDTYINDNINYTPWMCFHRTKATVDPASIGLGGSENWEVDLEFTIVVQSSNVGNELAPQEVSDELDGYIESIINVLHNDITLQGVLELISSFEVSYSYNMTDEESMYFQNAEIEFTARLLR